MKGFVRIIEVVIAAVLVFLIIFQFSRIPQIDEDWSSSKIFLLANDAIYSMDKAGVNWFDPIKTKDALDILLGDTNFAYKLDINNCVKSYVNVACICNNGQFVDIQSSLQNKTFNGRAINFSLTQILPAREEDAFSPGYNVIVTFDSLDYAKSQSFLSQDKGIVLIKNITSDVSGDFYTKLMEIEYDNSVTSPDNNDIRFSSEIGQKNETWNLIGTFYGFEKPGGGKFLNPHDFKNILNYEFLLPGEKVDTTEANEAEARKKRILIQNGTGANAMIANFNIADTDFKGRTVWLSDNATLSDDLKVLIRSAVAWTAGSTQNILSEEYARQAVYVSKLKVLNTDMYEPIEIAFRAGYFY